MKERGLRTENREWTIEDGESRVKNRGSPSSSLYSRSSIFYLLFSSLYSLMIVNLGIAQNANTKIDVLEEIGIEQKLNEQIPLDLNFLDATGQRVQLRDYFGEKTVILSMVYCECPMFCSMILNGLLRRVNLL